MKEAEKIERIALAWALSFQAIALRDLAAAFARYDRDAARMAIDAITDKIVADLSAQRQKFIESGWSLRPLVMIAQEVRVAIVDAKKAIEEAAKPPH